MRRLIPIFLLCGILLTGCGTAETRESSFTVLRNGLEITLGAPAAPVLEALGTPFGYAETKSLRSPGVDRTYHFPDLELMTTPGKDGEQIAAIQINGENIQTPYGITIGTSARDVLACCGLEVPSSGRCSLKDSQETMTLTMKNNSVAEILCSMNG